MIRSDIKVHVKVKLSALWASVMFCYVYGDYFGLYKPGKLQGLLEGRMPLGPITQRMLLGTSIVMAIPSLMVFLSLVLRPAVNRPTNIILGTLYTAIMVLAVRDGWDFYLFLGAIEVALTLLIVWYAWNWPKVESSVDSTPAIPPGPAR